METIDRGLHLPRAGMYLTSITPYTGFVFKRCFVFSADPRPL